MDGRKILLFIIFTLTNLNVSFSQIDTIKIEEINESNLVDLDVANLHGGINSFFQVFPYLFRKLARFYFHILAILFIFRIIFRFLRTFGGTVAFLNVREELLIYSWLLYYYYFFKKKCQKSGIFNKI